MLYLLQGIQYLRWVLKTPHFTVYEYETQRDYVTWPIIQLLLLLLSRFSRVRLCATP